MNLSFLDKASNVTPLLVRLYDSHRLYGLAKDKKPLARAELTTVVSDLLQMNLSIRESELVADVLIELVRQAEKELREALAERLSILDNVPLRLILKIANDDIEIARPVLKNSPVLGDLDLIYIIKSKSTEYWQAIATRSTLSDQVINILADTRDIDTAIAMAENKNIKLSERAAVILSDMAQDSETLAAPLLRREEIGNEIASKLYKFVGQELKKFITQNYQIESSLLIDTVNDVVLELTEAAQETGEFVPTANMLKAADRFKEKGLLTTQLMLGTLRRGQVQSFVAQFSKFTGLSTKTVEEVLTQPNGQGLAVACKAFGILKADFISIYLLTNRVRNRGRMVDMNDMTRAVNYYNRIKADVARNIMTNSQDLPPIEE